MGFPDISFEQALEKSGLLHLRSALAQHLKNSIFGITVPGGSEGLPVGASRMGGLPDLPLSVSWPETGGKPLGFLGQLNLSETKPFDKDDLLPASGLLYFFYDSEQSV